MAVKRNTKELAEAVKVPVYTYTVGEAAEVLHVAKSTIYKMINNGELKAVDLAAAGSLQRKFRITADALNAFLSSKKVTDYVSP
jgi:excisionase family DNA binding protein